MSNTNTGGPAFPTVMENRPGDYGSEGMTLRDYFAAKAIPIAAGGLNQREENFVRPDQYLQLAQDAYKLADAMLKAREA